jgi:mannose-1-phosphate guanylyltransferase/mannose-6-phosphate isomerase
MLITPVILCGGSGTRLWPVSRRAYPKQFARLLGEETPFQATARRVVGAPFAAPVVMTAADFRFIVGEQLAEADIAPGAIVIEPVARGTAPAILAAALCARTADADAVLLILPSDHSVRDPEAFRATVREGAEAAQSGRIVTFGIVPDRAETGYGYLVLPKGAGSISPLVRFVEKPDAAEAAALIAAGDSLWNSGIVLARADTIVSAFADHAPEYLSPVQAALDGARDDLDFRRLAAEPWNGLPDRSFDRAVLEKAANITAVRFPGHWSELGGWDSVWRESAPDDAAVVAGPNCTAIDCRATLLRCDDAASEVVGIGLSDIMVVATEDAVLVADRRRSQDVRLAVAALRAKGVRQAESFPRDHRPWGWWETLILTDTFQVKRIFVKPGGILSLQSHRFRAEHWVVVSGTARVTVDREVSILQANQSVYVPLGAVHRLEHPGDAPMMLIEVQTGTYFGEDDIIRYEDIYARS